MDIRHESFRNGGVRMDGSTISLIDDEILILLSSFLDVASLGAFIRTCRRLQTLEENHRDFLWEARIRLQYGNMFLRPPLPRADVAHSVEVTKPFQAQSDQAAPVIFDDSEDGNQSEENETLEKYKDSCATWTNPSSWKEMAHFLYSGKGLYVGFALDAFTSGFEPYPMEYLFPGVSGCPLQPWGVAPQNPSSYIRWRTLRDSKTRVEVLHASRNDDGNCDLLHSIGFVELELFDGSNILIPNYYKGYFCGPSMIGIFPNGAFFLLRVDSLAPTWWEKRGFWHIGKEGLPSVARAVANNTPYVSSQVSFPMLVDDSRNGGTQFKGAAVLELLDFDPLQITRFPVATLISMELILDKEPTNNLRVVQDFKWFWKSALATRLWGRNMFDLEASTVDWNHVTMGSLRYEEESEGLRTVRVCCITNLSDMKEYQPYDIIIATSDKSYEVKAATSSSTTNEECRMPLDRFMTKSHFYGFSCSLPSPNNGDCTLVGLLKDGADKRTGSFFLQCRDHDRHGAAFLSALRRRRVATESF